MAAVSPLHIPELIQHILGFSQILDSADLLSVSLVSRTWSQITRTVRWRELELKTESWVDPYYQALVTQLQKHGALVRILVLKECVSTDPAPSMITVHAMTESGIHLAQAAYTGQKEICRPDIQLIL
jgi:hypothetical protein